MPPEPGPLDFELRPGQPDDLDEVHQVFVAATDGTTHPVETRSPEEVRRWIHELPDRGQELWVAVRGSELLGFVTVRGDWLPLLFVHPGRPAQGVGSALLELVKALRPRGFGLRVHEGNDRARAFYRRHGLIELERTDGSTYQDASPDVKMAWLGEDPLGYLRARIDEVDDELAVLLARRAALTGAIQDRKEVGGTAGRDPARETAIVDRMHAHVPHLDRELVAAVMHTVIAESLASWERSASG